MTDIRWGILATGGIAHAFTADLRTAGLDVAAVGSRRSEAARAFAEQNDVPFLGDIPIVQSVMDGSEEGRPAAGTDPAVESLYRSIAEKVVENMAKTC